MSATATEYLNPQSQQGYSSLTLNCSFLTNSVQLDGGAMYISTANAPSLIDSCAPRPSLPSPARRLPPPACLPLPRSRSLALPAGGAPPTRAPAPASYPAQLPL
jgi:hypothetical protein